MTSEQLPSAPPASVPQRADVLLRDGTIASIRSADPHDAAEIAALRDLHTRLGVEGYRMRFFGSGTALGDDYVNHLATSPETIALVAERAGRVMALATGEPIGEDTAEVAFVVEAGAHSLGVGTLLLEHLAAQARRRGFLWLSAEVLAENSAMLDVLAHAGFAATRSLDHGTVELRLATAATPTALAAADARERAAETLSLRPLLHPRSVAVVGVRADGSGVGAAIVRSIVARRFPGPITVVHPTMTTCAGAVVRRSLVGAEPLDLAVIAVPAASVRSALEDAAAAGVRAAVVVSSGFEEAGGTEQRALLELARRSGMRLVGPNCLGILCQGPGSVVDATFGDRVPRPGSVAVASQSGGVGIALLDAAHDLALGLRYFVSLGDKVDVSGNDLLAVWTDDEEVSAAALYLESVGNPLKFARIARTFTQRKPLLAVVGGRSRAGERAGASHTASAATPTAHLQALFAQTGVIACADAAEMAEATLLLTTQPLPRGRRLGILSNAGGLGVIAADTADGLGLHVPALGDTTRRLVAKHAGTLPGTRNPVDAGAAAAPEQLVAIADAMLVSGEIDALLAVLVPTRVSEGVEATRRLLDLAAAQRDRPLVVVPLGSLWDVGRSPDSPAFPSIEAALRALAHAATYAEWRREPAGEAPAPDSARAAAVRARVWALAAAARSRGGWLPVRGVTEVLAPYGLAPVGRVADDPDSALAAAHDLGYPVAVKAAGGTTVHKSERGLVRLGLTRDDDVRTAVQQIQQLAGDAPGAGAIQVQPMSSGVEIALGVVRDARFGHLLMIAAGGVHTDVWADRSFLLPPITRDAAARAVHQLRIYPVLAGHRRTRPRDVEALLDLIMSLGLLVAELPEVAEVDINPVQVQPRGNGCRLVDVKLRLDAAPPLDAGVPRRLRDRT